MSPASNTTLPTPAPPYYSCLVFKGKCVVIEGRVTNLLGNKVYIYLGHREEFLMHWKN